jgi:hypothetical protein
MKRVFIISFILFLLMSQSGLAAKENYTANKTDAMGQIGADIANVWIKQQSDDMLTDTHIVTANNESELGIFAPVVKPPDYYNDPNIRKESKESLAIVEQLAAFLIILLGIYCVLQIIDPDTAGDISKFFNHGRKTYYEPSDIFKFSLRLGCWFFVGNAILFLMQWSCSEHIKGTDLSILSQFIVSSENLSSYAMVAFCCKMIKYYFGIREIIISYLNMAWYYIGLIFSFPPTRWIGILILGYIGIQIYVQLFIISILIFTINRVLNGSFGSIADMLAYGSMTLLLLAICFIALTFPAWLAVLAPNKTSQIINRSKGLFI